MKKPSKQTAAEALKGLERYCRNRDYSGYSKFDALNSPILERVFGSFSLGRLLITQLVNRIPLPLRPLFGVRKGRNPKGVANFVKGYCLSYSVYRSANTLDAIKILSDWLLANTSKRHGVYDGEGTAWGYHFPWQSPGFFAPRHYPNCIVTVFCAEALLEAYKLTQESRFLAGALGAAEFITKGLPVLESTSEHLCIGYVPAPLRWRVININAVSAGFLAKLGIRTQRAEYVSAAKRMIRWVVAARNPDYSWNYTSPKSQSGIGPDNYHTGGILDGIADYMLATGDYSFEHEYRKGLSYYSQNFFTMDRAPKWRAHRNFPNDIHGAAQGILTHCKAEHFQPGHLAFAEEILAWTLSHMVGPDGNFYYQKFPYFTWKLDLMRWSNSWMFWAMNSYQILVDKFGSVSQRKRTYDSTFPSTPKVEANI
ncbi:MAG: hypothetical protein KDD51_02420 [Bdellovibrionales bacterium]|nr:hypothetical protein [Bdellovibrionales bacterium]